jgi:hypothetical protein
MPWPDDVVGGPAQRRRALAEEHRRRVLANAEFLGVATVVHRLGHHPARGRHWRPQRQLVDRDPTRDRGVGRSHRFQALAEQRRGGGKLGSNRKRLAPR